MRKKKEEIKVQTDDKILDVNASMQGTLRFDDPVNLRISGSFEGTLDTKGKLMVGDKASINANITGEYVSIAGNVTGNIKATSLLELQCTAKLSGDIESPLLIVKEGAVLNGSIKMNVSKNDNSKRGDWMNVDQLGKYLEVGSEKVVGWAENNLLPATREGGEWVFDRAKVDQWIAEGKVKV